MHEHILVLGATSPMATATTAGFLARGDRVSVISRAGSADATASYPFDVSDLDSISSLFLRIADENGPVTRICFFQRYRDGAGSPWDGEYVVSLRATSKFIDEFQAQPSTGGDRSIVIVTSAADSGVVLEQPASYHAVKAGLSQLVRYYAVVLGNRRIRVNGVKPAIVLKPRAQQFYDENPDLITLFNEVTPLGRMGLPADIANAVLFLSSESASFITGQTLSVDGGLSLHEAGSMARVAASVFNKGLADPRWKTSTE